MGFFQTDEAAATISALKLQLREAEDVHRLKDQLNDSLERQLANSAREVEKLEQELAAKGSLIEAIHKEQVEFPISNRDLLDRLKRYEETWENLADYLTCPICYQPFSAGKTVVLFCGHAFCSQCQLDWEKRHLDNFRSSSATGQYLGADCAECRSTEVRRGKVRIYALEEVIRLVEKSAVKLQTLYEPPPIKPPTEVPLPDTRPPSPPVDHARGFSDGSAMDTSPDVATLPAEVDAASILRPRTPLPYGGTRAEAPPTEVD